MMSVSKLIIKKRNATNFFQVYKLAFINKFVDFLIQSKQFVIFNR